MIHYNLSKHKCAVSHMVNTKIWVYNSTYQPRRNIFMQREHLFSHLVVAPRHPCCDQVFDCDVQMKKDVL